MAKRMTKEIALNLAARHGIDLDKDYHAQGGMTKPDIIAAADEYGYRQSKGATRSRGYQFFLMLRNAAKKED